MKVPDQLRQLDQWVVWKRIVRDGRPTKIPFNAVTGKAASSTNHTDWCSYAVADANAAGYDGVGFVFVAGGGLVGIDLDNCLDMDGLPKPWAEPIIRGFSTYTEVSPSGKGVKMWAGGGLPSERGTRRPYHDGAVEMYDQARFFTVTGNTYHDPANGIEQRQKQIDRLWALIHPPAKAITPTPTADLDDQAIIAKLTAEYNDKAARLFAGNMTGYLSPSEADAALVCKIAFYTRDPAQIDRIYRASRLCREKWVEREDYRKTTIDTALATVTDVWRPPVRRTPVALATPPKNGHAVPAMIEDIISGKRKNIPWPWPTLTFVARALMPGSVTVLCGGAGSTKSMLVSEASLFWLSSGIPFAMFHLEKDRTFHLHRALAQLENDSNLMLDDHIRGHADEARAAYDRQRDTLDALGACMWDAPDREITTADLADWVRDRAKDGCRIITIDPITAADSGDKPWVSDRRFILAANKIMGDYGASLVIVTHPRDGNSKHGSRLENMAGGRAFNRMTDAVLWLDSMPEPEEKSVRKYIAGQGAYQELAQVNRVVQVHKARNGKGVGMNIGFMFDSNTLRFTEHGAIVEVK